MAFPFQQWPKFGDYLDWAVRQGCRTFHGCIFEDGGSSEVICIKAPPPSDRHVIVYDMPDSEQLAPAQVANFDRRLGLKSPWSPVV
jgi:hypothetical protein